MTKHQDLLAQVRDDLLNFPEEVFDQWLKPCVQWVGWPPEPHDRRSPHRWLRRLADGGKPEFWRGVRWSLEYHPLQLEDFGPRDRKAIIGLIDSHLNGAQSIYSIQVGEGEKERFLDCRDYLLRYGCLPVPPVVLMKQDGLYVCAGANRIAALVVYRKLRENDQEAPDVVEHAVWIGRQSK